MKEICRLCFLVQALKQTPSGNSVSFFTPCSPSGFVLGSLDVCFLVIGSPVRLKLAPIGPAAACSV